MSKSPFRTAYDDLQAAVTEACSLACAQAGEDGYDGMTQQQFAAECDINNIMARYEDTGLVRVRESYVRGEYSDLSDAPDFHTAMTIVATANESFMSLPASLRKRFSNDPAEFLEFVHNPDNEKEMRELGLLNPEVSPPEPVAVHITGITEPPPAAAPAEGPPSPPTASKPTGVDPRPYAERIKARLSGKPESSF